MPEPTKPHSARSPASPGAAPTYTSVAEQEARRQQTQKLLMIIVRLLYLVLLVTVSLLPFVGTITSDDQQEFTFAQFLWPFLIVFIFGVAMIAIDIATPNKRVSSAFAVFLGIGVGLVAALAFGALLDLVADSWELSSPTDQVYLRLIKLAVGITLCYLAISLILTTKDDFRLVIPYVEFAKQVRGVRPLLVDTSALIDARIEGLCETGFLDAPLILPQFVIDELQQLSDSGDRLKRERGRRGLALVSRLQESPFANLSIDETPMPGPVAGVGGGVDQKLVQLAAQQNLRILTTDYNLNHVAQIHNVTVLNINDLANTLKTQAIPGETMAIEIIRHGEGPGQGVGFMPDGTMVVVEDASSMIGQSIMLTVTNSLQTSAGKMIFGRRIEGSLPPPAHGSGSGNYAGDSNATDSRETNSSRPAAGSSAASGGMADAATNQPRMTQRPPPHHGPSKFSRRNPRR
jgi:uncharacterized protein YacL